MGLSAQVQRRKAAPEPAVASPDSAEEASGDERRHRRRAIAVYRRPDPAAIDPSAIPEGLDANVFVGQFRGRLGNFSSGALKPLNPGSSAGAANNRRITRGGAKRGGGRKSEDEMGSPSDAEAPAAADAAPEAEPEPQQEEPVGIDGRKTETGENPLQPNPFPCLERSLPLTPGARLAEALVEDKGKAEEAPEGTKKGTPTTAAKRPRRAAAAAAAGRDKDADVSEDDFQPAARPRRAASARAAAANQISWALEANDPDLALALQLSLEENRAAGEEAHAHPQPKRRAPRATAAKKVSAAAPVAAPAPAAAPEGAAASDGSQGKENKEVTPGHEQPQAAPTEDKEAAAKLPTPLGDKQNLGEIPEHPAGFCSREAATCSRVPLLQPPMRLLIRSGPSARPRRAPRKTPSPRPRALGGP